MLIEHDGKRPFIDETAYVSPAATLSGEVSVGPDTRVLHGAVLTSEGGPVTIGSSCIVMENAVIRGTRRHPVRIGDHVLVGPGAHLSGCAIEDEAFLATGTTVFNGATIGARAEIRVNGVVHVLSAVAEDGLVPIGWVAVGDPAEILPPGEHDRIWAVQRSMDFPGTVFGVDRTTPMSEIMARYTRALGRHLDDREIEDERPQDRRG